MRPGTRERPQAVDAGGAIGPAGEASGRGELVHGMLIGKLQPDFGDPATLDVQQDHLVRLEDLAAAIRPGLVQEDRVIVTGQDVVNVTNLFRMVVVTGNRQEAEDISQDAFASLMGLPRLR